MNAYHNSYRHRGGDEPLLGQTIPEFFNGIVARFPDTIAVVSRHQQRRLTYRQLAELVDRLARGLLANGFQRGDRIGIWSTNNIEWLAVQLATARIGAILVNINPAYRPRELLHALKQAEVQGLFTIPAFRHSDYVGMLLELLPELASSGPLNNQQLPCLRQVVIYEPLSADTTGRPAAGFTTWQQVMESAEQVEAARLESLTAALDRDDAINIQYTSGTTGFPKAVVLTHHNILNNAWFSARAMHFGPADRLCVSVPFYHCFGMVLANLLCLSCGASLVLPAEHFDALEVLRAISEEACTAVHGVPTMFIAMLEHARFNEFDLDTLRTGIMAGAPCPAALMHRVIDEMHCSEILIGYGETEASPLTHLTQPEDDLQRRIETVGRNLPHQEVKIVDLDSGQTVPLGETGEICFRGYHVMQGYYANEEATREAIDRQGWLHSGDLGSMDGEGYVTITGRRKEMIIRGGENIYPREIEDYLFRHDKVAAVAVFGVPDDYFGEEIMAWIQLHEGMTADEQDIRDYCRTGLAHFKVPKYIWFVDEFPMTVTGKLQKFRMRELAMERMAAKKAPA
jgi:fatty-acyl-CoA synthase